MNRFERRPRGTGLPALSAGRQAAGRCGDVEPAFGASRYHTTRLFCSSHVILLFYVLPKAIGMRSKKPAPWSGFF